MYEIIIAFLKSKSKMQLDGNLTVFSEIKLKKKRLKILFLKLSI